MWEVDWGRELFDMLYWFPVASVSGMASMDLLIVTMPGNGSFLCICGLVELVVYKEIASLS